MLILFTVVSVVTGAATVLFLRQVLTSQVDQTLQSSINRFRSIEPQTPGRGGPGDQGLQAYPQHRRDVRLAGYAPRAKTRAAGRCAQ